MYTPKLGLGDKMDQKIWLGNSKNFVLFDAYDLDFDPMMIILMLDLDMVVMYSHSTNEVKRTKRRLIDNVMLLPRITP